MRACVCLCACVCVCLRVYVCHYVSPHAYALNTGGAGADDLCIQASDVQAMHAFARPDLLKERKSKQRISGFIREGMSHSLGRESALVVATLI